MIPQAPSQMEGNREVLITLDKWMNQAKQGGLSAIALVGCSGQGKLGMEYAGVVGKEIDAYFGLERLQQSLMDSINQRQLPTPSKEQLGANYVVYNRCLAPHCFDFLCFLINSELERIKEGAPAPLQVCFHGVPPSESEYTRGMFLNVMRPLLKLVGAVENYDAINGRRYNDHAVLKPTVDFFNQGMTIPKLKCTPEAAASLLRDFPEDNSYVSITLREATHFDHRNSNLPEWIKFANYLKDQGIRVIFLRDTAKAYDPIEGFETYPAASLDVDVRFGFYERALANFGCANGPMTMCLFSNKPVYIFTQISSSDNYSANTPHWWITNNGITEGQQFPWCADNQRIVWLDDNFENIKKTWDDFRS